jgi:CDP-diacylglycerol--glycerol-3-phosphate 3-phosphatidyltransferase
VQFIQSIVNYIKKFVRFLMHHLTVGLNKLTGGKLTPNSVTWTGLVMHMPIAVLIATDHLIWGGLMLIVFSLFDTIDGELARLQKRVTNYGGFLDASTDRFKEVLLYTGCAYLLASGHHPRHAAIAVAACGASICVSYVKAKGEATIAELKKSLPYTELNKLFASGLFSVEVRMFVLIFGLLCNQLFYILVFLTLGATFTAFHRLFLISRKLSQL